MEQYVLVKAEKVATSVVIPEHWHTAEECRIEAEHWENEELKSCMDKVLAEIWDVARKGGITTTHSILTSRPPHFYETFKEKMEMLGYKVTAPTVPSDKSYHHRVWTFSW